MVAIGRNWKVQKSAVTLQKHCAYLLFFAIVKMAWIELLILRLQVRLLPCSPNPFLFSTGLQTLPVKALPDIGANCAGFVRVGILAAGFWGFCDRNDAPALCSAK